MCTKERSHLDYRRYKIDSMIRYHRSRRKACIGEFRASLVDLEAEAGVEGLASDHRGEGRTTVKHCTHEFAAFCDCCCCINSFTPRHERKLVDERRAIRKRMVDIEASVPTDSTTRESMVAFVSFNRERQMKEAVRCSKVRIHQHILAMYEWGRNLLPSRVREDLFLGKHLLRVSEAPEPSTIRYGSQKVQAAPTVL